MHAAGLLAAVAIGVSFATTAVAQSADGHAAHHAAQAAQQPWTAAPSEGEVRKVDRDRRTILLKHGAIANLQMPPMTMMFIVRDAAMLDGVRPGDKVRFAAENVAGELSITRLERLC